ncbi:hypothetical protein CEXT_43921 [Caerostris extrusa]|uniref:SHSP domain-containing protein n=1 Tax=Caerostris extrusa TaxID=172846 RepID=A0AAV4SVA5_CAEEX|nr:hypothetical protein CEXT_43921 [Caerostris extrusa]
MDQCFGMDLFEHDLFPVFGLNTNAGSKLAFYSGQFEVKNEKDKFREALDVKQFKPEEIEVKVVDKCGGSWQARTNGTNGFVSREFTRRYMLPNACDKSCQFFSES